MHCSDLLFRLNEDVCGGETHVRQDYQPGKAGNVPTATGLQGPQKPQAYFLKICLICILQKKHRLHCDDKSLKVEPDVLSSSGVKCQNL